MEYPELTNRYKLIKLLGEKCRMCPITNPSELEIDHIYNDGDEERAKYGSAEIYRYYLEHSEKAFQRLQVLCKDCHSIKTNNEFKINKMFDDFCNFKEIVPHSEVSKMQLFVDVMKSLEGEHKRPINIELLKKTLFDTGKLTYNEIPLYIKKLQRASAIYESRPFHYNTV